MAVNPKSLENLTKFEKGNKLGGRKKESLSLKKSLQKILDSNFTKINPFSQEEETKKYYEWVNISLLAAAMNEDVKAITMIYDRIDGKVPTKITLEGDDSALEAIKQQMRAKLNQMKKKIADQDDKKSK